MLNSRYLSQKGCSLPVAITIKRRNNKYDARVTPPHGDGRFPWQTVQPMKRAEVIRALISIGCHTTDIADALDEADKA